MLVREVYSLATVHGREADIIFARRLVENNIHSSPADRY
jgi:hypothetical protein